MGKDNLDAQLKDNLIKEEITFSVNNKKEVYDISKDKIFLKYANDSLPLNKKKSRAGLTPYIGVFNKKQKTHLLRRLTFGSTLANQAALSTFTAQQAVDAMVTQAATAPAPPLNYYENINPPGTNDSSGVLYGQTWVGATRYSGSTRTWRIRSLKAWWLENMLNQDMTIEEKMVLFFHSNYPIEMQNTSGRPNFHYKYMELIRTYCLGNLKSFVRALSVDGAMLWYLNGRLNTKTAPDENYARELQELFTVGKEGSTFSEPDVLAAAKVLTGWRVREKTSTSPTTPWESYFDASKHDITFKGFSSYYNNTLIIPNNTNPDGYGANELDDLINMIFTHGAQDIAKFFVRRIYRFFMYYDIDSTVETTIIAPLAQTLINSNWEIKPMLLQLFKSDHFWDSANMDCVIKSPVDYYVSFFRNMDFKIPATATVEERYLFLHRINQSYIRLIGMDIGDPPSVSGWPANYQVPFYHQIWINSDTMPKRLSYMDYFLRSAGIYIKSGLYYKMDLIGIIINIEASLSSPNSVSNPDTLVSEVVDLFLGIGISQTSKDYYKGILLSGQTSNYYWTFAWNNYLNQPANTSYKNTVETRLRTLFTEMLRLPEHHLA